MINNETSTKQWPNPRNINFPFPRNAKLAAVLESSRKFTEKDSTKTKLLLIPRLVSTLPMICLRQEQTK